MLATLRQYQDRVETIAGEAERLFRDGDRAALPRLAALRVDEGLAMAAYQLFVHREVFEPLTRGGAPAQREAARRLKVELVLLAGEVCHHAQTWSRRDAAAEWETYRAAALGVIAAIRTHVAQVRTELLPALADLDEPPLRRAG